MKMSVLTNWRRAWLVMLVIPLALALSGAFAHGAEAAQPTEPTCEIVFGSDAQLTIHRDGGEQTASAGGASSPAPGESGATQVEDGRPEEPAQSATSAVTCVISGSIEGVESCVIDLPNVTGEAGMRSADDVSATGVQVAGSRAQSEGDVTESTGGDVGPSQSAPGHPGGRTSAAPNEIVITNGGLSVCGFESEPGTISVSTVAGETSGPADAAVGGVTTSNESGGAVGAQADDVPCEESVIAEFPVEGGGHVTVTFSPC